MSSSGTDTADKGRFPGLLEALAQPAHYRQSIKQLHRKFAAQFAAPLYDIQPEGYTFSQAFFDQIRLSKILAKSVTDGSYRFSPARLRRMIEEDGKKRILYSLKLMDRIVHGAAYRALDRAINRHVLPCVYSYRKGYNRMQAIAALTGFLRAHRKQHTDPRQRGLYVLHCDILAYCDSVPVGEASPLWPLLEGTLAKSYGRPLLASERAFLRELIRPVLLTEDDVEYCPVVGIPTGAPTTSLLMNLYVTKLDEVLSSIEGGVYARYCDDMILMHPDYETFTKAGAMLDGLLGELQLARNVKKSHRYFFNAAGRSSHDIKGAAHIEYVGLRLSFDGRISLKKIKTRKLLRDLNRRIYATEHAARGLPEETRVKILCRHINEAFDPLSKHAHPFASIIHSLVNDRSYLGHMDYLLARMTVQSLTQIPGVRGFRKVSYRALRRDYGLTSLEYARNQ